MDSLEAHEQARALPEGHFHAIPRLRTPVYPIKVDVDLHRELQNYNQSAVFFLDGDVVLKMQTQTRVTDVALPSEGLLLDLSWGSFGTHDRESAIFTSLKNAPHPNLVRRLEVDERYVAFFERLSPLKAVLGEANMARRRRWVMELVSAYAHLENMGLVSQTRARDLGVDRTGRLKLVGFGSSPRKPSVKEVAQYEADDSRVGVSPTERYDRDMQRAHQRLACCLHYILSDIDPDQEASTITTLQECTNFRKKVRQGTYPIAPAASCLRDVLQDAWMLKTCSKPFSKIVEETRLAFEGLKVEQAQELAAPLHEDHYRSLEHRCREWIKAQTWNSQWMSLQEYEEACKHVGHEF